MCATTNNHCSSLLIPLLCSVLPELEYHNIPLLYFSERVCRELLACRARKRVCYPMANIDFVLLLNLAARGRYFSCSVKLFDKLI